MKKNFFGVIFVLSFGLLFMSGCAKDIVKPDDGIAAAKAASADSGSQKQSAATAQQSDVAQATAQQPAVVQQLAVVPPQTEVRPPVEVATLPIKTIYFDFDSYVLSQPARDIAYNNAEYLLKKYRGKIKIEGHCDERGSDEYNLALGENRAKAVMNYLLTLGVPAEQLSIISYGKERPVDKGNTEEAWAKNRRVEFVTIK